MLLELSHLCCFQIFFEDYPSFSLLHYYNQICNTRWLSIYYLCLSRKWVLHIYFHIPLKLVLNSNFNHRSFYIHLLLCNSHQLRLYQKVCDMYRIGGRTNSKYLTILINSQASNLLFQLRV
jgi:hypothetical protein